VNGKEAGFRHRDDDVAIAIATARQEGEARGFEAGRVAERADVVAFASRRGTQSMFSPSAPRAIREGEHVGAAGGEGTT
jgi:hypothetical protein